MADEAHTVISRSDARAAGLKRYFTGKECRRGHVAARQVSNGVCCECFREIGRKYRTKWPERKRAQVRRYQNANLEWKRRKDRESYQRHREKRQQANGAWLSNNLSHMKEYRREWAKNNRERLRVSHRNRRARKRLNGGRHTAGDIRELWRLQRGKCACCRVSLRDGYHVDHIMPLASGGRNDRSNLQLLCPTCNMRKSKRDPIEFMQSVGRLL